MAERKTSSPKATEEMSGAWRELSWRKLEKHVYRMQKRIYRASQRGNRRQVEKLQKLLLKSEAARLLAVRRVTQDNQGKKTAGVDGVKSVPPKQRFLMVKQLHAKYWKHRKRPKPVRRVWIPKPGKAEQRPLGIPTMMERAKQALVKLALEPAWEAMFEPNSYGFRPGRSCHDAIGEIFLGIRYKPKFVFDADIKGCFDHIDQEALLKKLNAYPKLTHLIRGWLKAGVMEGVDFTPTERGTPQGGVISPLLANVALHGLETQVTQAKYKGEKPIVVRYADDFVILQTDKTEVQRAAARAAKWREGMGLRLSPSKTRITHTLDSCEGNVGFDFLGFHVRQYRVGKTHTGKDTRGKPLGYRTIIRPSKEAVKRGSVSISKG
jgi:RNA-directed DNA polymerase